MLTSTNIESPSPREPGCRDEADTKKGPDPSASPKAIGDWTVSAVLTGSGSRPRSHPIRQVLYSSEGSLWVSRTTCRGLSYNTSPS